MLPRIGRDRYRQIIDDAKAAEAVRQAVKLGYRGETLTALLIMLGSPATVSCFSMARSMGHEGVLSASAVMLTTVCSAFTFTVWLYLLKSLALI